LIEPGEIERFRRHLACRLETCDWYEDHLGAALCRVCGSGFVPTARKFLEKLYGADTLSANHAS
jgi:hypothetical protein